MPGSGQCAEQVLLAACGDQYEPQSLQYITKPARKPPLIELGQDDLDQLKQPPPKVLPAILAGESDLNLQRLESARDSGDECVRALGSELFNASSQSRCIQTEFVDASFCQRCHLMRQEVEKMRTINATLLKDSITVRREHHQALIALNKVKTELKCRLASEMRSQSQNQKLYSRREAEHAKT